MGTIIRIRQTSQVRESETYDDSYTSGSDLESNAGDIQYDLNAIRSQLRHIIDPNGNWYDQPGADLGSLGASSSEFAANCLATDLEGMFVYVTDPEVGGVAQVSKVDITTQGKYPGIGIIKSKSTDTDCIIQFTGPIVLSLPWLTPGSHHFIGLDSRPTVTPPNEGVPGGITAVQQVGTALSTSKLLLNFGTPFVRRG